MGLKLFWKDIEKNNFLLGFLDFKDSKYYFEINEEGLKDAIKHGCFGIGEFNLLEKVYTSEILFPFFKRRIPHRENVAIDDILKEYNIEKYDEMELLRKTKGELDTDRYYLEE